jgi:hypothetical protein
MSATATALERRSNPGRLISAAAISIVTYCAARAVLEMDSLAPAWRVMAAVVPVPFFVWVLYEILRSARNLDELQRRMHLEALAFAYPLLLTLLMLLGLLELAVPLNPDNWSYRHVWQMQGIVYLIGLILAYRRYGVGRS